MNKEIVSVVDPETGVRWDLPKNKIRTVHADVQERWLLNMAVTEEEAASYLEAPFLEPILMNGFGILSLCIIVMDRAAPDWAPITYGPAVTACALRVACRRRDTKEPSVWVATRSTDHVLGKALPLLGFPDVATGLRRTGDLMPALRAPGTVVDVELGTPSASRIFSHNAQFDRLISDGIRSYGRGASAGEWSCIDLIKDHPSTFTLLDDRVASITIQGGARPVDSIYRCPGGRWSWEILDPVDDQGISVRRN